MSRTLFGFYDRGSIPEELIEFLGTGVTSEIIKINENKSGRYPSVIVPSHVTVDKVDGVWRIGPVSVSQDLIAAMNVD